MERQPAGCFQMRSDTDSRPSDMSDNGAVRNIKVEVNYVKWLLDFIALL